MSGFGLRKHQRLKELIPVRYLKDGVVGEGLIKELSLTGSSITGNAPVSLGDRLTLQLFMPGDSEPVLIDQVIVKWLEGAEFGVDLGTLTPQAAEHITRIVSTLIRREHGSPRPHRR